MEKKKKESSFQMEGIAYFLTRGRAWHAVGIKKAAMRQRVESNENSLAIVWEMEIVQDWQQGDLL